jgi:hypothetical protein
LAKSQFSDDALPFGNVVIRMLGTGLGIMLSGIAAVADVVAVIAPQLGLKPLS